MTRTRHLASLACLLGAILATGCNSLPTIGGAKTPAAAPAGSARSDGAATAAAAPAQSGLKEGVTMYNNGDYNDAIKRLGAADVAGGPKATQLEALKYTAFSYCVTSRQTLCRLQFEKALKLDPSFDLDPGEHGHPLWGPVFVKAKKSK
ncbi:MAG: TssQ family T6SS-associated lipoprotein [Pseudomonadota bacterium]